MGRNPYVSSSPKSFKRGTADRALDSVGHMTETARLHLFYMTDTASLQAQNLSAAAIFNFGPYKQSTKLPYLSERLPLSMFVHAGKKIHMKGG